MHLLNVCPLSFILLDGEEVFALECAILRQVCAVNGVADAIGTESSSQSVWSETLSNFWVHGANEVAEGLNCIFLANLQCNARASRHLFGHLGELWEHTRVNLEELLGCWPIQVEHLHGADLKALIEDGVNDLTCHTSLDSMGLNNGTSCVGEHGTGAALTREPHAHLGRFLLVVRAAVNGILDRVNSIRGSQR